MSKNKSIQEKLENRSPATMRQLIKPVDMLESEQKQPEITNERTNEETKERSHERTDKRTFEYSNERTKGRTSERSDERTRIRHSFDIYEDQLLDLKEIALHRQKNTKKRVLLGDLVQEALDAFIEHQRTNVRTNV